ncbi:rho guanyl nucleotide exchange factor [Trichoderma arundinaceum]|uniref:Rho guanyl nucleotide exchange factor n=1 Tax=Trichoderma arundinaceum TaxID=490622 RepID=A0A395P1C2_TRIAR|nr:rho guanyl nucleotide exchange factor [Trichoderma arundinaceum]
MVRVTEELALSPEHVALYHAADPLLGQLPVLIFHGPSTTANYTLNSSRVQVHVFTPAGFQSFPRITISPSSPFYSVVNHLPREFQGDEVYRGLAFGLFRYFKELPENVKTHLKAAYPPKGKRPGSAPVLFSEQHAADLVKEMVKSENTNDVVATLDEALQTQHVSNVDIDFILPPGSIVPPQPSELEELPDDEDDIIDPTLRQYGAYTPLIKLFGEPVFLPTSKLRRAPSKPTPLNRNKTFTKDQKIELRMKMGELVDTEERYVLKVQELVKTVANDFRNNAKKRSVESLSPSEEELEKLFPKSSDGILQVNSAFVEELRKIMDETEEDAVKDMETPTMNLTSSSKAGNPARTKDPLGALAMAKLFLEWFPKFTQCYQDYIKASQHFPTLLNSFLDQQSSFRQRVSQAGEQTIRSLLIEPVQRLPRYSLLIDQIIASLPITHPALQPMLKARDIITNICSMDDPLPDKPHITNRLRNMVESWPADLEPQGRLILAADFLELSPPYQATVDSDDAGIFLLFSDCIAMLRKSGDNNMTGRDLLREIDKPSAAELLISMTNAAGGPGVYEFIFTGWHHLADVRFTESADGHLVWMTSSAEMKGMHPGEHKVPKAITSRCFLLQEAFEGKAAKWSEDVVKARVEARFSETEREDPRWTLRSVRMPENNLGLHAAIFQEGADQLIEGRREPAFIRVVVDHEKGTKGAPVGHYGVEVVINVASKNMKRISLLTVGLNGKQYQDDVALEDFLPTMSRRSKLVLPFPLLFFVFSLPILTPLLVMQLLSIQFNVSNRSLTAPMVSYHSKMLRTLCLSNRAEKTRSFLAASPVKLFTSLWSGGSNNASETTLSEAKHQHQASLHRADSHHSMYGSIRGKNSGNRPMEEVMPENPLVRLEQTFEAFTTALQYRKGSIHGRTLLHRAAADELLVNDLYNRLIENPFEVEVANDVGTEVVFTAFENFLHIAWAEQIGPVTTIKMLDTLQERANKRVPGEFADFVNFLFKELAPQNRRAFTALIKLLADLLDGCSNDSDRGALTLAFSEMLVTDGSAANYINLLDRLVDDCDRIFGEPTYAGFSLADLALIESFQARSSGGGGGISGSGNKSHQGSVTSNTSSLRRKFGFDMLLRQNSKEERTTSVWRSLGKHRNPATGESASMSRATMQQALRQRSIDDNNLQKRFTLGRPGSGDRPHVANAFEELTRPPSAHRAEFPLDTIGEPAYEPPTPGSPRRHNKRRSSLSDLKSLLETASIEEEREAEERENAVQPLQTTKETSEKVNASPKNPPPSKIPISPNSSQLIRSPRQKENIANTEIYNSIRGMRAGSPIKEIQAKLEMAMRGESPSRQDPPPYRRPKPTHSKTLSTSNIPTLLPPKPIRPGSSSGESPSRTSGSPTRTPAQKLRLQSPQKLRERLQTEKTAVGEADAMLQSELFKIGEEMARVNSGSLSDSQTVNLQRLASSVASLEDRMPGVMQDLRDKQDELQRDVEITLKTTESKMRSIDQLHKEAVAENELLYERFNTELAKIVKALKGKGKEDKEELIVRLKTQGEELAKMKKENARLKREMISLRAALKGTE